MWRGWAAACHHLALYAYPPAFRRRFGHDLQQTFLARISGASSGRVSSPLLAIGGIADAVLSGLAERLAPHPVHRHAPHTRRSLTMRWESLRLDVILAVRQFTRAPLFSALVILTMALGIGANAAIFSTVHAVLLKPLPYSQPEQLMTVWSHNTNLDDPSYPVSPANFDAFVRERSTFSHVEGMYSFLTGEQITVDGENETIQGSRVTAGMFEMLGRRALWGRGLQAGDDQSVVLSHAFWMRRFGGDPSVIGRTISRPAGAALTIVGVMPEDFVFPYRSMLAPSGFSRAAQPDAWMLLTFQSGFRMLDATGQPSRTIHMLAVVARLASGKTAADGTRDLTAIASRRATTYPDTNKGFGVTVRPLMAQTTGAVRPALLLLSAGVGLLLLLTCVNIANVLLARATSRQRDSSVRAALGATRRRLLQQHLVESGVLALAGGVAALGLVAIGTNALLALAPSDLPRLNETRLSPLVVGFTLITALVTGMLTGLLPAITSSRARAEDGLRESRRTTSSRAQQMTRSSLVVAEIALATLLTVGAGLLLRSFVTVLGVNPGFEPDHVLTFQVSVPQRYAGTANTIRFYDELSDKLRAVPGITHIGGSTRIPLGSTQVSTQLSVQGRDLPPSALPEVQMRRAVHDYFGTMNIPVVDGRAFSNDDRRATELIAVVNAALAAKVFPGESAVGRRVQMGGATRPEAWLRIIGVVGNIRHTSLEETPQPEIYISHFQGPPVNPFMVVRTSGDPAAVSAAVREAVKGLGADAPTNMRTMNELRQESVGQRQFVMWLTGAFGLLALLLAGVGVYGVIALVVSERTAEVGVRLALGASPTQVWGMLVRHAVMLGAIGVGLGLTAGLLAAPLASSLLYGITASDPVTFVGVGLVLLLTAGAAAALPAARAMRVDPSTALRAQ